MGLAVGEVGAVVVFEVAVMAAVVVQVVVIMQI